MKTCSACKLSKPLALFTKNRAMKDGLANQCKLCFAESNKKTRAKHKEKVRTQKQQYWTDTYGPIMKARYADNPLEFKDKKLQQTFGITLEEYNQMLKSQNDCCAICKRHKSEFKKALAVDHCHTTDKVRGLLCNNCNNGIGRFKDKPEVILAAASYVALGGS